MDGYEGGKRIMWKRMMKWYERLLGFGGKAATVQPRDWLSCGCRSCARRHIDCGNFYLLSDMVVQNSSSTVRILAAWLPLSSDTTVQS
ncbi:hypothetical protein QYF36_019784 [Acer negundo]|nr:hypothetical protein QYF36_019784 [Acer negundo]